MLELTPLEAPPKDLLNAIFRNNWGRIYCVAIIFEPEYDGCVERLSPGRARRLLDISAPTPLIRWATYIKREI
jgi:hypothetical protein